MSIAVERKDIERVNLVTIVRGLRGDRMIECISFLFGLVCMGLVWFWTDYLDCGSAYNRGYRDALKTERRKYLDAMEAERKKRG